MDDGAGLIWVLYTLPNLQVINAWDLTFMKHTPRLLAARGASYASTYEDLDFERLCELVNGDV